MTAYLGVVAGAVVLAATVYFRRGRGPGARWWVNDRSYDRWGSEAGFVVGGLPALGGIVLALSLGELGQPGLTALGGVVLLLSIVGGLLGMVFPRLLAPRWWRRERTEHLARQAKRRPGRAR